MAQDSEFLDLSFHLPGDSSGSYKLSPGIFTAGDGSSDGFLEICLGSDDAEHFSAEKVAELVRTDLVEEEKFKCGQTISPENDGNSLSERDGLLTFPRSLSEKVGMPDSPCQLEFNLCKSNPKTRFSPFRKVLDPILKSKSQRNPSVSATGTFGLNTIDSSNTKKNQTLRKSLLHDFSKTSRTNERAGQFINKDQTLVSGSSPAHLCGLLKMEHKRGVPFFEFSLKDPEEFLAAKTWITDSAFNWVYTFHSVDSKTKSSGNGWGSKDRYKQAPMVGQMQVTCYLCSERRNDGLLDNTTVTEFLLYDIARARKILAVQEGTAYGGLASDVALQSNCVSEPEKGRVPHRHAFGKGNYPWVPMHLKPHLEIAAIVVEVPFGTTEILKDKRSDKVGDKEYPNLCDFSIADETSDFKTTTMNPAKVKVVTPSGMHGLPSSEEGGPSPLLNRWRSGGGCDCGGWDMACPIVVFENPCVDHVADYPFVENQRPLELFVQGAKEKVPALTIRVVDEGLYSVDFHAQLSALQAFSICVALLHGTQVSTEVGQERERQRMQSNSLKVLLEEEVRLLIKAVAEEEKRKATKRSEEIPPSFVLDPPFSPIGRV
ncbi:uncharacterized protein LOC143857333 isoform X2 [Tasmannia lanceolata]